MKKLVQTSACSIVYGNFKGKENQELFRCPRELDDADLRRYINETRCFLKFEADTETESLKEDESYIGYYRLYFRDGWFGRWMEISNKIDRIDCHGVDEIIRWLQLRFPKGCTWDMKEYLEDFPNWGSENRYLLKPFMSEHYKVMFDTTYGNSDYPVRIYVYK